MASKRKQDEKNLKTLRELASKEHNKKCFDCGQRGPTYVNMTIGSFVCTSCSGLLRGLNPPQRVKSISMTSFTQAEIEQLQKSGNEYCRQVWLGLWNSHLPPEPESRDEQKVKDFLIKKYEKKAYYVPPDQVKPISREKEKEKVPEVRPLKSLLGENSPKVQVTQNTSPAGLGHIKQPPASINQPVAVAPPPGSTATTAPSVQPKKPSQDLLGDLGGDPFGAPQAPQGNAFSAFGQSQGAGGFADFSQAFGGAPSQQAAGTSNQNAFGAFGPPASQASGQASFAAFSGATMTPTPAAPINQASKSMADLSLSNSSPSSSALSSSDKYSALSELDSIFSSNAPGSNTSSVFGATSSTSSSSVFGQTPPSTSGFGQSSSSSSTSLFGQTPTATSSFGQTPTSSSMFGQPPASTSVFGASQSSTVPASGMEANPFGGFAAAPAQPASQPNPFMMPGGAGGQPNGMFGGTSQAGGFGWDTSQSTAGFGQMPQQTPNMGGFGQFGATQGMVQPGMVGQSGMVAQPGMAMGTQPHLGAGAMQLNGGVNRGMPPTQQGSMNMGYNMQAQGGFGIAAGMQQPGMGGMQYNKAGQMGGGFGQMAPSQPPQAASFGTWNPSGGGLPQQHNPFMGQSAAGIPPKGQSSNPFM